MKEPGWIEERDARASHGRLLALHGGAAGLRDEGLRKSALARPRQIYAYADAAEAVLKLAARLIEEAGYTDFLRRNSVELLL